MTSHELPPIIASRIIANEWLMVSAALGLSVALGGRLRQALRRTDAGVTRLARRRVLVIILVGVLPVLLRLAMLPVMGPPNVQVEEEASARLQADTFASGRLANPPLPFPEHFDTMQVLQRPTYSGTRPPGPALFMAIGQVVFGTQWAGVCLSIAAMCAATCWMLQGWFAPRWALLGGLLIGIRLGVLSFWMNSYWGGAVAALGGTLVLGAYPRLVRTNAFRYVFIMWVGIVLLLTTRTYEGGVLLIPVAIAVGMHVFCRDRANERSLKLMKLGVPAVLLLAVFAGWCAYYNQRVTGSATTTPYTLGRRTQNIAPPFIFGKPGPMPSFSNPQMRWRFAEWEMNLYLQTTNLVGWWSATCWKVGAFWKFYIRPLFTVPIMLLPFFLRSRKMRLFCVVAATGVCGALLEVWGPPYYFAPYLPVVMTFTIEGLRYFRGWRIGNRRPGVLFTQLVPGIAIVVLVGLIWGRFQGAHVVGEDVFQWSSYENRMPARAVIEHQLLAVPGKHIVFVNYGRFHNVLCEWVFNDADLNSARIIWSRTKGVESDQPVAEYFSDRQVWLVQADRSFVPEEYPGLTKPAQAHALPARNN